VGLWVWARSFPPRQRQSDLVFLFFLYGFPFGISNIFPTLFRLVGSVSFLVIVFQLKCSTSRSTPSLRVFLPWRWPQGVPPFSLLFCTKCPCLLDTFALIRSRSHTKMGPKSGALPFAPFLTGTLPLSFFFMLAQFSLCPLRDSADANGGYAPLHFWVPRF